MGFSGPLKAAARLTIPALLALAPASAYAGLYWFEFGGGVAQMEKSSAFYGGSTPNSLGLGGSYLFGAGLRIASDSVPLHLAIQHRLVMASSGSTSYGLQTTYPILRAYFPGVYLGFGFTPLVWKKSGSGVLVESYQHVTSATAMLGEIGFEMPITPEVSFNLSATGQLVQASGGGGLGPTYEGTASFRFFYGQGASSRIRNRGKFRGWRYPFGIELNN